MMHVIVGVDAVARGALRRKILKKAQAQELRWESMAVEEVATIASTPSLLGDTQTYLLVGALNGGDHGDEYLKLASGFMESPHVFVFEEEKLLKAPTTKLEKAGVSIEVLEAPEKKETFNVFALANALASRDRKQFWLLLTKAARAGVAGENVAGVLHWKVRDMLGSNRVGKYTREELVKLSRDLMSLYHDSHRGAGELTLLLERFALTL